jgi:hypothetical protein
MSSSIPVARDSLINSTQTRLLSNQTFAGVSDAVGSYTKVKVAVMANVDIDLTIYQGINGVFWDKVNTYSIPATPAQEQGVAFECPSVQTALLHRYFYITAQNTDTTDASFTRIHSQVFNDGYLDKANDSVVVYGEDAEASAHPLLTDASGALIVSSSNNIPVGQNTDFAFFPDATNLTSAIYADGDQPLQTTPAGWVYTNSGVAPNKINWYVFQDTTLPQYLVSEMDSIYFVISQLTPATTLPFVGFYTMPNGIDDVVPSFAKSKLVFAPSNLVPTAQGEYLFYVKSDPVHIRPEITNRYELTFVPENSSKTLAQASGERLSLSTLSTNSSDPAGANYFLFQQYGITWAKTSVPLPVNNGLLDCNIVSQAPVTLAPSTADIGYVRLTAENLLSNPSTFANLQIVGANLEVEDQQAIGFLTSIDGYSNSINTSTTSIASSNVSMESRLTNMDTKMITLSNTASTKTLTQTGANWTTDYTTLQSLTLSNVGGLVFSYVKLYNKATAPDQNDTPVMTIPLNHETVQQVVCNSLLFNLGIGVRATNAFVANDNTAPSGTTYATAFYKLG